MYIAHLFYTILLLLFVYPLEFIINTSLLLPKFRKVCELSSLKNNVHSHKPQRKG